MCCTNADADGVPAANMASDKIEILTIFKNNAIGFYERRGLELLLFSRRRLTDWRLDGTSAGLRLVQLCLSEVQV